MSEPAGFLANAMIDPELRLIELRVLGAIVRFYEPNTGSSPFIRKHIRLITGYPERNISAAAHNLETAGWITRTGATRSQRCIINWNKLSPITDHHDQQSQPDYGSPRSANSIDCGSPRSGIGSFADHHDQQSPPDYGSPRSGVDDQLRIATISKGPIGDLSNKEIEIGSSKSSSNKIYLPIDRESADKLKYGDAYNMLLQFGMPEHFARKPEDKNIITNWITKGLSVGELFRACEWAKEKKSTSTPLGPKYVDGCINTLREVGNGTAKQPFAEQNYKAGRW